MKCACSNYLLFGGTKCHVCQEKEHDKALLGRIDVLLARISELEQLLARVSELERQF